MNRVLIRQIIAGEAPSLQRRQYRNQRLQTSVANYHNRTPVGISPWYCAQFECVTL